MSDTGEHKNGEEETFVLETEDSRTCDNGNKNGQQGTIVLGVNVDCEGCVDKVYKTLHGFEGVEVIEIDAKKRTVTVKGKKADPGRVANRLRKKMGKHVELISPKPKKDEKKKEKEKEKEKEKKKPKMKVIDVKLTVNLHCEGCAKDVRRWILQMEGVQTVDTDVEKNLVTVKGALDTPKLIDAIKKRSGKHVEVAKPSNKDKNKEKGPEDKNSNKTHPYPYELFHAPKFFSDENPNACSVM